MTPYPPIRRRRPLSLVCAAILAAGCAAPAGDGAQEPPAGAAAEGDLSGAPAMVDHLGRQLRTLRGKIVALAEAMPEDRYAWRPMDGVRSVGEVFTHMAGDNYFVPALMGVEVPAGAGVTGDPATVGSHEEAWSTRSRSEIVADLERSFDAMEAALEVTREDPERTVELRGNALTAGDLWVRAVTHLHEHLGQSIAYARSNHVVPPWSR